MIPPWLYEGRLIVTEISEGRAFFMGLRMQCLAVRVLRISVSMVVAAILLVLPGCATIVKSSQQGVDIITDKKGSKISTAYYQNHELQKGVNCLYLKRSRDDIRVSLKCSPKSKAQTIYVGTSPGGWFLAGNLLLLPSVVGIVGYVVDFVTEEGWNIQTPVNIGGYCSN